MAHRNIGVILYIVFFSFFSSFLSRVTLGTIELDAFIKRGIDRYFANDRLIPKVIFRLNVHFQSIFQPVCVIEDAAIGHVRWGLYTYFIAHTVLVGSPVILWISLGGKPKWLPLKKLETMTYCAQAPLQRCEQRGAFSMVCDRKETSLAWL